MWRIFILAGVLLTISAAFVPARAATMQTSESGQRRALVIGNAAYAEHPLQSTWHDASDMSTTLSSLGFDVTRRTNLNDSDMRQALASFAETLGPRDTALVYFAGHGLQAGGDARLVPLDADEHRPVTLIKKGLAVHEIVDRISRGRVAGTNIVVLDMCLDAPFGKVPLREIKMPAHSVVVYAAEPGTKTSEDDRHGFFTKALMQALKNPSHFRTNFLSGELTLNDRSAIAQYESASENGLRTRGILPKDSNEQYELTFWESIKDSTYPSDYEAYLKAYPNGRFAALAKARIERLHASAAKPAASSTTPAPAPAPKAATPAPASPVAQEKPRPTPTPAPAPASAVATAAKPAAKAAAGNEIKDCPTCPALIPITPGSFSMGSNNDDPAEKPPHRVTLAHAYAIGKTAVTVEQWNACVDAGACTRIAPDAESNTPPPANSPMRNVSWDDAQVYVKWLSKTGGKTYRLPTEAEWEYAARGGTQDTYWWGNQFKKGMGDCKDCGDPYNAAAPTPVASFAANPYGLYDMNGSVWEWVADCWHSSYKGAPADGRTWDDPSCSVRVIRGGSWRDGSAYMQSATRFKYSSSVRQSQNGFRVVREMQ
ncbi:SUMF1/EgtB/PvdO family nonheme iron enzyme [Caballeronia sp. BR00000012568055]|uniref:SUMF1/EgtB/PvdO family nonheme iron enzyme n=1 Tax=Caballeronia sp. BR00000012568055 TaxID=2918761 RepID=UPI0023F6E96E|nr:SUMF1/EgtB/PvdO family nonheme iron enzyme [Caballeronia sp. BR00000012568055]